MIPSGPESSFPSKHNHKSQCIYSFHYSKVRVRTLKKAKKKKEACPARVAKAGQENIETVHEQNPYKPQPPSKDKVAVLWRASMAHKPDI